MAFWILKNFKIVSLVQNLRWYYRTRGILPSGEVTSGRVWACSLPGRLVLLEFSYFPKRVRWGMVNPSQTLLGTLVCLKLGKPKNSGGWFRQCPKRNGFCPRDGHSFGHCQKGERGFSLIQKFSCSFVLAFYTCKVTSWVPMQWL